MDTRAKELIRLRRLRLMLRAKKNRLYRDITRYRILYPTPQIAAQLKDWRAMYKDTVIELAEIETQIAELAS